MKIFKFRRGVLRVFWPYIRPYTWKIGLALAILLLDTLADLASPWPIKLIFDNALGAGPESPVPLYRALRHFADTRSDQRWLYLLGYASAGNNRAARHLPS